DGVADVPLDRLMAFHKSQGKLATVTAVPALARFGNIVFDGDRVTNFAEKRVTENAWINGGYMVMEPGVLDYLTKDEDVLEIDLLERLTHDGQLTAYRHEGFWQCMDTLRDKHGLERLWLSGAPPWKGWGVRGVDNPRPPFGHHAAPPGAENVSSFETSAKST